VAASIGLHLDDPVWLGVLRAVFLAAIACLVDGTGFYLALMTQELPRWTGAGSRDPGLALAGGVPRRTGLTIAPELGFAFLIWYRLWRPPVLTASPLVHTAIRVTMGLAAFSASMLTGCPAFVPPEAFRVPGRP
jgi:hypothetical protein